MLGIFPVGGDDTQQDIKNIYLYITVKWQITKKIERKEKTIFFWHSFIRVAAGGRKVVVGGKGLLMVVMCVNQQLYVTKV